jgi:hypothetical protein
MRHEITVMLLYIRCQDTTSEALESYCVCNSGNSDSALLHVVPSTVYKVSINSIMQPKTPSYKSTPTPPPNRDSIFKAFLGDKAA